MAKYPQKLKFLRRNLERINEALPSSVYIPFVKGKYLIFPPRNNLNRFNPI